MICHKCKNEIEEGVNFCPKCGEKIVKNDDNPIQEISENNSNIIKTELEDTEVNHDLNISINNTSFNKRTFKVKSFLHKLRNKKSQFKLSIIATIYILVIIFFCSSIITKMLPNKNIISLGNLKTSKMTNDMNSDKQLKEIHISDEEYNIMPGQVGIITYYTYPEEAETKNLTWKSSNPNIKINQSGYITSTKPSEEGIITLTNADGTIKDQCKVKVLTKQETFFRTLDYINNNEAEKLEEVNLYVDKYKPGNRMSIDKTNFSVDVFSKINTEIPSYQLIQKQFINSETKNSMDCDIYIDWNTGDIKKIVTIEYLQGSLEITDYYYTDGSVYFIFKRNENYYRPVPAQQDFPGNRYYYYQDSLLKWRDIQKVSNAIFEKTDYSYNNKDLQWKKYEYKDLDGVDKEKSSYTKASQDSVLQKQMEDEFLKREKDMLNAAYNIYNKAVQSPRVTSVIGYVLDSAGQPMSGVTVKVFSEQYKILVGEASTNSEGLYKVNVPIDDSTYSIYVSEEGYNSTTVYDVDPSLGTSSLFQENVYMFSQNSMMYNIRLNLINALNGGILNLNGVQGNRVVIRRGINNKKGAIEKEFQLNDSYNSIYNIQLYAGNYTAEVISPGRENSYFTISTLQDNMEVYSNIVPKITDNAVRIVLSWGQNPSDLDSHLFLPNDKHIAYYSKQADNGNLDVDDTSSYGPETITLENLEKGTYKYYVADYTNCSSSHYTSTDMSNSFAKVDVYTKNGLTSSFTVPRNRQGVIWQVFSISNGKIIPVQRYFNNIEDMEWWSSSKR